MKHNFINKKTGTEARVIAMYLDSDGVMQVDGYDTVEDLMDDYAAHEDHKPAEPLIKDEKIRKAIRAWAEANDANVVSICALSGGWGVRYDLEDREGYGSIDLLFKGNAPLGVGNQYTIDELCGEEE